MAVDTIFAFVIFFRQFWDCRKSHLMLTHHFCGTGKKQGFKRQTDVTWPTCELYSPLRRGGSCGAEGV